ncbi:MAG: hemolysin III family protein [Alphaproteobacteria bacterium]|nr:hemolysin III family protein [Alphaproteobacteria bacterium]
MDRPSAARRSDPPALPFAGAQAAGAPFRGYFRPEDIAADRWVHLAALLLCIVGVPWLLAVAGRSTGALTFAACAVYSVTLTTLFVCSTAFYHLPLRIGRRRLRQIDHAAIFLLIAGTCTPFTVALLQGAWAAGVTAFVWSGALAGAIYKLVRPSTFPGFSTPGYGLIGITVVAALGPVLRAVDRLSLLLIVAGLAIYVLGAVLRLRRALRYRNTIWHTMVIAAAACHFAAIVHGVVLRPM